jgi:protein arginine N-methyltransferase 3
MDGYVSDSVCLCFTEAKVGYALLYESMLDSVLHARDRFLKPGGLIAPTESRMQLALCDAADVRKGKISFWEDVYGRLPLSSPTSDNSLTLIRHPGFDMSAMSTEVYNNAIIDIVAPESLLSEACPIKVIQFLPSPRCSQRNQ